MISYLKDACESDNFEEVKMLIRGDASTSILSVSVQPPTTSAVLAVSIEKYVFFLERQVIVRAVFYPTSSVPTVEQHLVISMWIGRVSLI